MCNDFQQNDFCLHQTRPIYQAALGLQLIVSAQPHDFMHKPPCFCQTRNWLSKMCHHRISANSENSIPLSVSYYCCLGCAAVYSGSHILIFLRILKTKAAYCSNTLSVEHFAQSSTGTQVGLSDYLSFLCQCQRHMLSFHTFTPTTAFTHFWCYYYKWVGTSIQNTSCQGQLRNFKQFPS
jgi:hypothetical protein